MTIVQNLFVVVAMLLNLASSAQAAEPSSNSDAREVGRTLGTAVREVGQGAKKVGKEIGQGAKEAGKAVGGAAREGGREFKRAVTNDK